MLNGLWVFLFFFILLNFCFLKLGTLYWSVFRFINYLFNQCKFTVTLYWDFHFNYCILVSFTFFLTRIIPDLEPLSSKSDSYLFSGTVSTDCSYFSFFGSHIPVFMAFFFPETVNFICYFVNCTAATVVSHVSSILWSLPCVCLF